MIGKIIIEYEKDENGNEDLTRPRKVFHINPEDIPYCENCLDDWTEYCPDWAEQCNSSATEEEPRSEEEGDLEEDAEE